MMESSQITFDQGGGRVNGLWQDVKVRSSTSRLVGLVY